MSAEHKTTRPPIFDYAPMWSLRPARQGEATEDGAWLYGCARCSNTVFVPQEVHRSRQRVRCGQCAKERADV